LAQVSLSTAKRLARKDTPGGRELRALMNRNMPRRRARRERESAAAALSHLPEEARFPHETVAVVPELVADADAIGGPPLGEMVQRAWEVFEDPSQPDTLRKACFDAAIKIKAAPVLAELQRQANAVPVAHGPERVRIALPDKRPLPDA
jgi:hypothetical protein